MKVKTSELTGAALDWAVATALGHTPTYNMLSHGMKWAGFWERTPSTPTREYRTLQEYSTDWAQGGPIIERERIGTTYDYGWARDPNDSDDNGERWLATSLYGREMLYGPTPLIAAMRCFVASKLGEFVDIPEELTK